MTDPLSTSGMAGGADLDENDVPWLVRYRIDSTSR